MAARIGITSTACIYDGRHVEEITRAYISSVLRAGGLPVILPILEPGHAESMLDGLDGLLLSGGGDLDPVCYGGEMIPEVDGVDPARDAWELALVTRAGERGIPVLGVCRGAQVLNVAAGGTLIPDLPTVSDVAHRERERFAEEIHPVEVLAGSRLAWAMGRERAGVNTLHHQAVDRVGRGLRAVAWGPDGFVEAVESTTPAPALGVQWHPELLPHVPGHPELFTWLVEAADQRAQAEAATAAGPQVGAGHEPGINLVA
jgi:putative glutamine amidotransferase